MSGADEPVGWQPVETDEEDVVGPRPLAALHDLLDDGNPAPPPGGSVPILWHWLAFLPRAAQHELGPDGHPRRGGFMPPVDLPRRMIAGGRVEQHGELTAGMPLRRRAKVAAVDEKHGRSGRFVLVTVRSEIGPSLAAGGAVDGPPLLVEEQHIAYRAAADPAAPEASAPVPTSREGGAGSGGGQGVADEDGPGSSRWSWRWDLAIEPALLFRFSALTYNAHRIHYDRLWATEVEGYPGLVVHGPLQAVALAELCRRQARGRALQAFDFRATSPKFDDGPLLLRGAPDGADAVELVAFDAHGMATMRARAVWGS